MVDRITPSHDRRRPGSGSPARTGSSTAGRWSPSRSASGSWRTTSWAGDRGGRTPACCSATTSGRGSSTSCACSTPPTRPWPTCARWPASCSSTRRWPSRCGARLPRQRFLGREAIPSLTPIPGQPARGVRRHRPHRVLATRACATRSPGCASTAQRSSRRSSMPTIEHQLAERRPDRRAARWPWPDGPATSGPCQCRRTGASTHPPSRPAGTPTPATIRCGSSTSTGVCRAAADDERVPASVRRRVRRRRRPRAAGDDGGVGAGRK